MSTFFKQNVTLLFRNPHWAGTSFPLLCLNKELYRLHSFQLDYLLAHTRNMQQSVKPLYKVSFSCSHFRVPGGQLRIIKKPLLYSPTVNFIPTTRTARTERTSSTQELIKQFFFLKKVMINKGSVDQILP